MRQAVRGIDELGKHLPQTGQSPVDTNASIGGGNAKSVGDLAVAQIVQVAQLQDKALTVIEV
jgi:hypothetical protein